MGSAAAAGAEAMAAEATSPLDPPWPGPGPDGRGAHGLGPASSSPSHPASPPHDIDSGRCWPPDHDARCLADNRDLTSVDSAQQLNHNGSKAPHGAPPTCHPSRSTQLQQPTGVAGQSPHEQRPLNSGASREPKGSAGRLQEARADRGGAEPALGDDAPPPERKGLGVPEALHVPPATATSSSPRAPAAGPLLLLAHHHLVPGPPAAGRPTLDQGAAGRTGPGKQRPSADTALRQSDVPTPLAAPQPPAAALLAPCRPRSFSTSTFPRPRSPPPGRSSGSSCIGLGPLGSSSPCRSSSSLRSRGGRRRPPLLRPPMPPRAASRSQEAPSTWETRATFPP